MACGYHRPARSPDPKVAEEIGEAALSTSGLGVEARLEKVPKPKLIFDGFLAPTGATAKLADLKVTDNLKIPKEADSLVGDVDARACCRLVCLAGGVSAS